MKGVFKFLYKFVNTKAATVYLLLFAAAIGVATFIENDFGTSAAQKLIYKATWFEVLLVLFSATLIANIVKFKFIQQKKWSLLIFHLAMVIIIIGAGITRYVSYEGIMHIREGSSSNVIYSNDNYLNFYAQTNQQTFEFEEPVLFASIGDNSFQKKYFLGQKPLEVEVLEVIPNPVQEIQENGSDNTLIEIVYGGANGRETFYLEKGKSIRVGSQILSFGENTQNEAIQFSEKEGTIYLKYPNPMTVMTMATQTLDTIGANTISQARLRSLYNTGQERFVISNISSGGTLTWVSAKRKIESSSELGVRLKVTSGEETIEKLIVGRQSTLSTPILFQFQDLALSVSYGARKITLPFSVYLKDFIMDRYPGTESPASFESKVILADPRNNLEMDYHIYMNHILDYEGFRFFQSSYDRDEKGTYLSVNHDFWGTTISYLGYFLLTLGMVLIFFSRKTRFAYLSKKVRQMQAKSNWVILLLFGLFVIQPIVAQPTIEVESNIVSKTHAELASKTVVQDFRGRMKPLHTLSREIIRKVSGSENLFDANADQLILSLFADPSNWYNAPIIKIGKHDLLAKKLGIEKGARAPYNSFFEADGSYKLRDAITETNNKKPVDRDAYDKQLIKIDERVNIMNMVFSGSFLKVIPLENDPNNTWVSTQFKGNFSESQLQVAQKFFPSYRNALKDGISTGNYQLANQILVELNNYQQNIGASVIPSPAKQSAEILLNKSKVFNRLAILDMLLGLAFLALLFIQVFKPNLNIKKAFWVLLSLVLLGFVAHTTGLGLRWFVSGRAPWSNGYESMIYIAWTTTLAGVLFSRKSLGGLAATMTLSGTVLLIAMLSYLDPEITPLVPVLKSYWLTIHVSLEAGSYGFLMLGAIIGFINLLLIGFATQASKKRVQQKVKELSYISEMTLIGGLVMLSIGTYLGGVWANESWGRYWGWDAKETWALVSILVYAFILHMRLIPGLKSLFAFNFATLFGLASIIMTYFGVNYYLSGLHSYAAGDPVPIPTWVYVSIVVVIITSAWSYWRKRRLSMEMN